MRSYRKSKRPTLSKDIDLLVTVQGPAKKFIILKSKAKTDRTLFSPELLKELQDLIFKAGMACSRLESFAEDHPEITKLVSSFEKSWCLKVSFRKRIIPNHIEIDKNLKLLNIGTRLPSVYFKPRKDASRAWKIPTMYAMALFDAFKDVLLQNGLSELSQKDFQKNWEILDSKLLKTIISEDDAQDYILQADKPGSASAKLRNNIGRALKSLLRQSNVLK